SASSAPLPPPGERRRIDLNRRRAIIRAERIDVRPSRGAIVPPLAGFLLGAGCIALIVWGVVDNALPYWLLALLLLFALFAVPLAGITLVYALFGANVVFDRAKQSGAWQQGFLGMGIGTTELVPFWKIAAIEVAESGESDDAAGAVSSDGRAGGTVKVEEFVQWEATLVKESGKRLRIAGMTVPRPFERGGFAEVHELAAAIAALPGAPLRVAGAPPPEAEAAPDAAAPLPSRAEAEPAAPAEPAARERPMHRKPMTAARRSRGR